MLMLQSVAPFSARSGICLHVQLAGSAGGQQQHQVGCCACTAAGSPAPIGRCAYVPGCHKRMSSPGHAGQACTS